ncbi:MULTISPECIES: Cof-type HAD-IIB family hydrolase [Clostridium]|uniref:Cof-type HAD-IIB family hydrolase n=1 Tax=Clostridium saudiense TaxID=1414720 RepID=A0ABS2FFZ6_9CLOT|nr:MULTISPECIES: Cof-type HAD-IIB family hydrolase [Clostridium]MBM6819364.1 Cof-type HAD-IIB family hydrolase [Clostridium saudiense]
MYRIIFLDIDGTLRDETYGIPETTKTAIKMCKESGYYICLCTGRSIGTITNDVLDLEIDGIIAGGGSYIEFHNKVIKKDFFKKSTIEAVSFYLKDKNDKTAFTFETDDIVFMNEEAVNILSSLNNEKFKLLTKEEKIFVKNNEKIIYQENINDFNARVHKVNKICLWSTEEVLKKITNIFTENEIQLAQSFIFDSRNYYEIIQSNCNKGQAIISLCNYLNININETIAFGDGRNDIDMLKVVGTAIGIKNGSKEIFQYVDSICEEPKNDGIYSELKRRNII